MQKLRSAIQTSRARTSGRTWSISARSWAWASSHGTTSVTSIRAGSRTTRLCPGRGPAVCPRVTPQAPLGGGQVVAVEDPAPGSPAAGSVHPPPSAVISAWHRPDTWRDQPRGHARLDVPELVVDALEGDGDALAEVLVGGLDVEGLAADDQAHQIDRRGEQQLPGVARARRCGRTAHRGPRPRGRARWSPATSR